MKKIIGRSAFPWRLDLVVIINSMITLLYHATGASVVGAIGKAFSVAVVLYLVIAVLSSVDILRRYGLFLAVASFSLVGTIAVSISEIDPVDLLKYVSLYAFYFAATSSRQSAKGNKLSAAALVFIPLMLLPFGSRVYNSDSISGASFSYFQTYNAAVIYFTAVLFYLYPLIGRYSLPIQLVTAVSFGKIGALLASGIAFTVWNVKLSARSISLLVTGFVIAFSAYRAGLFERAITVLAPLWSNVSELGLARIAQMSYGQIVVMAGTTDISGYFRIKHWMEIWQLYSNSGASHILFGYGPGQTKLITTLQLVPHNDYLRILVEFGPLNFFCFVSLIVVAVRGLPNNTLRSLFTIYVIYSFTDNIIDNFTSIALLFGGAGLFARLPRGQLQSARTKGKARKPIVARDYQ